jgi:hypothetical protein
MPYKAPVMQAIGAEQQPCLKTKENIKIIHLFFIISCVSLQRVQK